MKKVFQISLLLCMIGLTANYIFYVEQRPSNFYTEDAAAVYHSPLGENDSAIFSAPNPFHFYAETPGNSYSEIEPRTSASANLASKQDTGLPKTLYVRQAERICVSQSVRTLIYPFHSFL